MLELAKLGKKSPYTGKPSANKNEEKKPASSGSNVGLALMAGQALAFEKETGNPEAAAFAGQFAAMLAAMFKMLLKD